MRDPFWLIKAILHAQSVVTGVDQHSWWLLERFDPPLTHAWAGDRQAAMEQRESWVITGCLMAISRYNKAFCGIMDSGYRRTFGY